MGKTAIQLTDREYTVMDVLWDSKKDLTITEISDISDDPKLTVACIAQVIPRLLKKEVIHVEKFINVNTKYARTFLPDISREDYIEGRLRQLFPYQKIDIKTILDILVHINSQDENDALVLQLESFIQAHKKAEKRE